MVVRRLQQASGLPSVIFLVLLLISIASFVGVNHLVVRFHEQEKALGRRLYAQADAEQAAGRTEHAIPYLRAAISYTGDNPQYQLSLARALGDTGRTQEAESYLIRLWETLRMGPSILRGQAFRARKRSDSQHSVLPQCRIRAVSA